MDSAELAIVENLAKNHLVYTKAVRSALLERHFNEKDVEEALVSLERSGMLSRIKLFGEENLALTKTGLRAASQKIR
ncbi:MAG: hypothetical protein HYS81_04115 [Candidatus Aenigmatarchaeota archaeon]|nr:MAG: hypothetical protein HYS81_04115 [Candidatus Aenigmarchaeota archaeon]